MNKDKSFAEWLAERKSSHQPLDTLTPEENTELYGSPTRIVRKYPEAADNKGRVTDGVAKDLKNQAEAYQAGTQRDALDAMTWMGAHADETTAQRNARRRKRQARRS